MHSFECAILNLGSHCFIDAIGNPWNDTEKHIQEF